MAQTIKLRRSATAGATPTTAQLELGEVAINTYDGKMYIKKSVGGTDSIVEIGSGLTPADAILEEYLYTATASQTAFSGNDDNSDFLSYTAGALQVFLNGILLDPETDYTATNGSLVTLTSAAALNDYLQIFAFKKKIGDSSITINTFTGNNSTTAYTLTLDPGDENNTRVFIDGVYQSKSNYTVSGTTLTFSSAPPSGTGIEVEIGNRAVSLDTASNLDLPDNVKLRLGASQDLEIYHNGSHSYIDDAGTGNLYIRNGTKNSIFARTDGEVVLYHNNANKLATTSTGVDVTGNIVVSGTVDGRDVASDGAAAVAALPKAGGAMTGAITTNSTFDGRNVSVDGTKLDGIETGATADQTQSEINGLGITATGLSGTPAISVANITTTGELRGPASFVVDPAAVGDNTGTVIIRGNLQVDGATTTINSTTLTVDDLNLTLASGAANGTAANGAGITVDGASATITYNSTGDSWDFNKNIDVTGAISSTGNIAGSNLNIVSTNWLGWGDYGERISGSNTSSSLYFSTDATTALTLDGSQNATFAGDVGMVTGHSSGKFAVMSSSVHGSYDFYNNGTSYFNGSVIVDDVLNVTGTNKAIQMNGVTRINGVGDIIGTSYYVGGTNVIDTSRNLTNIGTIPSGAITSTGKVQGNSLKAHVGTDDGSQLNLFANSSGHCFIAGHTLTFNTGANNSRSFAAIINSSGNVGIGTPSPQQKLAIVENQNYSPPGLGNSGGHFGIFKKDNVESGAYGIMWGVQNDGKAWQQVQRRDGTTSAYDMLLQPSGGNVGIGETSPGNILHVKKTFSGAVEIEVENQSTGNASYAGLFLNGQGNNFRIKNWGDQVPTKSNVTEFISTAGGSNFVFSTASTERMRISSDGYVSLNRGANEYGLELKSAGTRSGLVLKKPGTDTIQGSLLMLADESLRLGTASVYNIQMYQNGDVTIPNGNVSIGPVAQESDTLTVTTTTTDGSLRLVNSNAGSGSTRFVLENRSTSPAANDGIGEIQFIGKNSAGNANGAAYVSVIAEDVTNGSYDSSMNISTLVAGYIRNRIRFTPTQTVVNEDSVALNFRVESNNNDNMIHVDGTNDRVGIGRVPATHPLEVQGYADFKSGMTVAGQIIGGFGAATTSGTTDWNHSTNARSGMGYTLLLGSATNGPGGNIYYHPVNYEYISKNGNGNMTQLAIPYNGSQQYIRYRYSGTWSSWSAV